MEFAYFPCPVSEEEQLVADVLQEIAPQPQQWEFVRELNALKLDEDILWRIYSTLSYGEKNKSTACGSLFKRRKVSSD